MSKEKVTDCITAELLEKAVSGDKEAMQEILNYYKGYIRKLATNIYNIDGTLYEVVNKDMEQSLYETFVRCTLKFDPTWTPEVI